MSLDSPDRLARAQCSLEGLSVGDAFGERFFAASFLVAQLAAQRQLPVPPWRWTDDTAMAIAIVATLRADAGIDPDRLAVRFADAYSEEPLRGYAEGMHRLLPAIRSGAPWRSAAGQLFGGQGSYGNGAAMRVAPLGGYFADDLPAVVEHARRSTVVTHAHPEGVAGAIAVAVAAALAWQAGQGTARPAAAAWLEAIVALVPPSEVRSRLLVAQRRGAVTPARAAVALGNGSRVSAQDTVPFALWCAAHYLDSYEDALWAAVSVGGDIDTNGAIVGGIVALYTGVAGIPEEWRASREPLPPLDAAGADADSPETVTLFRPVGPQELALIRASGYRAFPPRLPAQPIFYPVRNLEYACQIARDWNVKASGAGYVTRFQVRAAFLRRYPVQVVGGTIHAEHWIPAEDLAALNQNLVGPIEVVATFG